MSFPRVPFFFSRIGLVLFFLSHSGKTPPQSSCKRVPANSLPGTPYYHRTGARQVFRANSNFFCRNAGATFLSAKLPRYFNWQDPEHCFFAGSSPKCCLPANLRGLLFFSGAHLGAARPRIALNLLFAGAHWLSPHQLVPTLSGTLSQRIFHNPIFKRVKADHHQPSARLQHSGSRHQQRFQIVQFTVYEYSESLKSSSRRMNPLMLIFHWPGRGRYHLDKLRRRAYWPRPDNGSGD